MDCKAIFNEQLYTGGVLDEGFSGLKMAFEKQFWKF